MGKDVCVFVCSYPAFNRVFSPVYIDVNPLESILRRVLLWEKILAEWLLIQEELVIVLLA